MDFISFMILNPIIPAIMGIALAFFALTILAAVEYSDPMPRRRLPAVRRARRYSR